AVPPGVYEVAFGVTLREVLDLAGGVTGELHAVLLGGAAGAFVLASELHGAGTARLVGRHLAGR
ncbi:MAG: hypothetical protein M3319_12470, partial [Actinomycetota bacterium]|nr:hypothetical protein [Actinomycetota bacterium]